MIPGDQLPAGGKRNTAKFNFDWSECDQGHAGRRLSASVSKSSESQILKGMTRNLETGNVHVRTCRTSSYVRT